MPAGRPRILDEEMLTKASEYLEECKGVAAHTLLPTIEGLALELHISRETVYAWAHKSEEENAEDIYCRFSDIVNELKAAQAQKLIQNGLAGRYNSTIAKLILSGKHNYVEKQETDVTSNGKDIVSPVLVRFVGEHDERADDRNTD